MTRILVGMIVVLSAQFPAGALAQTKVAREGAIALTLNPGAIPIDEEAVRAAIERRHNVAVRFSNQVVAAETRSWITLDFDESFQLRVHVRDATGRELVASMELPGSESKVPDAVARFVRDLSPRPEPCVDREPSS